MGRNDKDTARRCSFCGRDERKVSFLIPSPTGVCICDKCVAACEEIIEEYSEERHTSEAPKLTYETLPKPWRSITITSGF